MIRAAIVSVILVCFPGLTSCKKQDIPAKAADDVTQIPVCFLVDPQTGRSDNEDLVQAFNEAYEGRYELNVEWITESAEGYRARMKTLNGVDQMPAIITDVGFDSDFYQLLVEHGRLVDLAPFMQADEAWREAMDEHVLEVCEEEDGSMYMAPIGNSTFSYAGFYYNKELFAKAGIDRFPDTWTEFFQVLDQLQKSEIVPLALHGGSSYWTALLIGTNYMAGTEEGAAFLQTQFPKNYQNDSMRGMMQAVKALYQYTDADALEIEHDESARRFQQGINAIMANGGWMIMNFTEEEMEHFGFAPFPGNILMEEPKMSAWAVTSGYSEEVTKGATEFLKFRVLKDQEDGREFMKEANTSVLEREYKDAVYAVEQITPNYQLKWEGDIQNNFFVNQIPLYVREKISQDEFLMSLNEAVHEINEEK